MWSTTLDLVHTSKKFMVCRVVTQPLFTLHMKNKNYTGKFESYSIVRAVVVDFLFVWLFLDGIAKSIFLGGDGIIS